MLEGEKRKSSREMFCGIIIESYWNWNSNGFFLGYSQICPGWWNVTYSYIQKITIILSIKCKFRRESCSRVIICTRACRNMTACALVCRLRSCKGIMILVMILCWSQSYMLFTHLYRQGFDSANSHQFSKQTANVFKFKSNF